MRPFAGVVTLAALASLGARHLAPARADAEVGKPAPLYSVLDTRGATHALASDRGRWIVLEWFNPDCPFTRKQYDSGNMQRLQRTYTAKGVVWLSVNSSGPGREGYTTAERAEQFAAEKHAAPTAVVRDTAGALGRLYGARNTPQLFVIDPAGTLVYAGAIDDKPTTSLADVPGAHNYVAAALDEAMSGRPVSTPVTQPYGCIVQYAAPRRITP